LSPKCDACLRIGGPSQGADEMVALARSFRKQVFLRTKMSLQPSESAVFGAAAIAAPSASNCAPRSTPGPMGVRACQCSFCRSHGAAHDVDAAGSVRFSIPDNSKLNCYRFGIALGRLLRVPRLRYLCGRRDRLAARRFRDIERQYAVAPVEVPAATAISYEGEDPAAKTRKARSRSGRL